ncbi:2-hydroxyacid dehydrogenase [Noviherbaspirillum galbum]|uniref:Glyoxylate/hydroxypyruvate reductase A n=1 Tax=Noviherbaspirillum galbum TaxID=2709383 RepID=A0A6B3SQ98_9BURK|nr:glyoxylate/hydroxypyruvate reductase A [Noviherbaspirillum galbum]NEX60592.1 glyoxylate/hydroxypyruvate reductase A [Noviherbaspirillum galbum]
MRILFYKAGATDAAQWLDGLASRLPGSQVRAWTPGDDAPADYALLWKPPAALLRPERGLKAIFSLGAGVDALLDLLRTHPGLVPDTLPLVKLDDAGMGRQMAHYACAAVLRQFRRFDDYARAQASRQWQALPADDPANHAVAVLGLGALGSQVATALAGLGFPVRGWRRRLPDKPDPRDDRIASFAGSDGFDACLSGANALVNLLPLTAGTENILNRAAFGKLARGAHVINLARGAHLVDDDLIAALASGQVGHATLDVFRQEPLPPGHPFWGHPGITITPHVSALTLRDPSLDQIAGRILAFEAGGPLQGMVDRSRGY